MLNAAEARVLGSLMEKEETTPEYYPLSLNALVNASNQKSSREPVLTLNEAEVRGALFALEEMHLVRVLADARVPKFEHRVRDRLGEPSLRRDEVAVLCLLLLRGPQTAAELRARADRLYAFDDQAAVLATLERLGGRAEPLTRAMERQPGAREVRWRQLLTGVGELLAPSEQQGEGRPEKSIVASPADGLEQRLSALEGRVQLLAERLGYLEERLGAGHEVS